MHSLNVIVPGHGKLLVLLDCSFLLLPPFILLLGLNDTHITIPHFLLCGVPPHISDKCVEVPGLAGLVQFFLSRG